MFKNKDWKELLQEFIDKVDAREELIQSKIDGFHEQGASINAKIRENSARMIELEMAGDTGAVEKFKKENQKLRLELEEIKDSVAGYANQLGTSRDQYAGDLKKIQLAAKKAEEERLEQERMSMARLDELEAEIDKLKEQMEQTKNELRYGRTTAEDLKWQFRHIDPRVTKLPDYEQEQVIKSWLAGDSDDVERLLDKSKAPVQSHSVTRVEQHNPAEGTTVYGSNTSPRIGD